MEKTIISPHDPSPDEYNIAAMLSAASQQKILALQEQIVSILGDVVWLTPSNCLHSTLMEIIWNTQYKGMSRRQHFETWHAKYNGTTKDIIAKHRAFTAHFTELFVSPGAIILKAENTHEYNAIRNDLLKYTKLPEGTKLPPTIVHSSIARYNKSVPVEDVRQALQHLKVDISEPIRELRLVTDLVPIAFDPKTIETYPLHTA